MESVKEKKNTNIYSIPEGKYSGQIMAWGLGVVSRYQIKLFINIYNSLIFNQ